MEDSTPKSNSKGISRRKFLRQTAFAAGAAAVLGVGGYQGYAYSKRLSRREAQVVEKARILIIGAGPGGITVAARILRGVPNAQITILDDAIEHHYKPGYTLVAAGVYPKGAVVFRNQDLIPSRVRWIRERAEAFEPERNRVLTTGGQWLEYDFLVVAVGVHMDLDAVEGLREVLETPHAGNIYDLETGTKFRQLAAAFTGGDFVGVYPPGYVKCGGAPQKITWLTEDLFRRKGVRGATTVTFATPTPVLFAPVPVINDIITPMMEQRGIRHHFHTTLKAIDVSTRHALFEVRKEDGSTAEERLHYDLLHPMAPFVTPKALMTSPLTTPELKGQVEVDKHTLQHKRFPNIFAVGDCAGTGAAKTAATIRKMAPVVVKNLFDVALGQEPSNHYDGMSGCPLLTRYGRCMMFEFDYTKQLRNEWIYQSTRETRLWWNFKVHGLKPLYMNIMLQGLV